MNEKLKIALVGAHGLVGKEMLKEILESDLPIDKIVLYGSKEHMHMAVKMGKDLFPVLPLTKENIEPFDFVFFSGNEEIAEKYAPMFQKLGAEVIDNSSFFRMQKEVPLVIPEINKEDLLEGKGIYANPNCTTILLLLALAPLHEKYHLERIDLSSYQSVSGAGKDALDELRRESKEEDEPPLLLPSKNAKKKRIYDNLLPVVDVFLDQGYTKEEMKIRYESKKILHDDQIEVNATCVRVPTSLGHAISVKAVFKEKVNVDEAYALWKNTPYLLPFSAPDYPSLEEIRHRSFVAVGRLRKDLDCDYTLHFFVSGDNIVRGASYNALEIARYLWKSKKRF